MKSFLQSVQQDVYHQDGASPNEKGPEELPWVSTRCHGRDSSVPGTVRCNSVVLHSCICSCSTGKVFRWPKLLTLVRIPMFKTAINILDPVLKAVLGLKSNKN